MSSLENSASTVQAASLPVTFKTGAVSELKYLGGLVAVFAGICFIASMAGLHYSFAIAVMSLMITRRLSMNIYKFLVGFSNKDNFMAEDKGHLVVLILPFFLARWAYGAAMASEIIAEFGSVNPSDVLYSFFVFMGFTILVFMLAPLGLKRVDTLEQKMAQKYPHNSVVLSKSKSFIFILAYMAGVFAILGLYVWVKLSFAG